MERCDHKQCCLCLRRECQISPAERHFRVLGGYMVCGESCIITAISVAHNAACRLGGVTEKPCGKAAS